MHSLEHLSQNNANNSLSFKELEEIAYSHLVEQLDKYKHFPTFEYYPSVETMREKGWHYVYPSPFIHANVMYALINANSPKFEKLIDLGVAFILESKEEHDLWRFWNLKDSHNAVPLDVDDTAVNSMVLYKLGYNLSNKALLYDNIDKSGHVLAWILPSVKMLLSRPRLFFKSIREKPKIKKTIAADMLAKNDTELGISANVLMYLGQNKHTQKAIRTVIEVWKSNTDNNHYYEKKIVIGYHLARAYKEGVFALDVLKNDCIRFIDTKVESFVFTELLFSYLTLYYFKVKQDFYLLKEIEKRIISYVNTEANFLENYPYFTSKNRVFNAGSSSLTAALLLEIIYIKKNNNR